MAIDQKQGPGSNQPPSALKGSADLSKNPLAAIATTQKAPPADNIIRDAKGIATGSKDVPPAWMCKRCLKLSFFFDGTGNNKDSDLSTFEHSNVVRLFQTHIDDDDNIGLHAFYIPGLGTYFKDIGDNGDGIGLGFGLGLAAGGQARLDWALKEFNKKVAATGPQILSIKVAVFGFSRGSASARAFCHELAKLCDPIKAPAAASSHSKDQGETNFKLKKGGTPIEINFLGLFDTVASVGLPTSVNNLTRHWFGKAVANAVNPVTRYKSMTEKPELYRLAFGDGGIDPAPGPCDGHFSWGKNLKIPPLVKRCVHMIAGHEVRNSFPVDSTLDGYEYPNHVEEMVYPGAHSDVGGGYRPEEGARAPHSGEMLSLIPLHVMYDRACRAGVPLRPLGAYVSPAIKRSFALDEEGAKHFEIVKDHFTHYMNTVGWGGGNVGNNMLRHMKMYYLWTFVKIYHSRLDDRKEEDATLKRNEEKFSKERATLDESIEKKRTDFQIADRKQRMYEKVLGQAERNHERFGTPVSPKLRNDTQDARRKADLARDDYLRETDKRRTAANDSNMKKATRKYDEGLLADAEAIRDWMKEDKTLKLRPHYQALMDAYHTFEQGEGMLKDEKIIAFFDRYVHDSLAGFDTDQTRRSDPRVVYIGGDRKLVSAKERAS